MYLKVSVEGLVFGVDRLGCEVLGLDINAKVQCACMLNAISWCHIQAGYTSVQLALEQKHEATVEVLLEAIVAAGSEPVKTRFASHSRIVQLQQNTVRSTSPSTSAGSTSMLSAATACAAIGVLAGPTPKASEGGTVSVKWAKTTGPDDPPGACANNSNGLYMAITAMPAYQNYSFEELRVQDYDLNLVPLKLVEMAGKEALEMRDSKGDSSLRGEAAPAHAGSAPQNGAAGNAPRHMTPCACHCAACRAAGHGNKCVVLRMGLLRLFHGEADPVDLVLQHYYHGASGWDTAHFHAGIFIVQYGPAGDVIAAGDKAGRIHLICARTGAKCLCLKGHR